MANKRHRSQIPVFNANDRYTFFNNLLEETSYPAIDIQKRALYRHADNYYNGLGLDELSLSATDDPQMFIGSAIEFLCKAAENERRKEIHAVEYYLSDLLRKMPASIRNQIQKGRTFQDIINELKKMSHDLATGKVPSNQMEQFYIELTTYINTIKQNIIDFQARVHEIANDMKDDRGLRAELASMRLKSDFQSLFSSISGQQARNTAKSFSSRVRNIATDYLIKQMKIGNIDPSNHFTAILAGIIGDFEHYVQHDRNLQGDFYRALDQISKTQLEQLFDKYITSCDTLYLQRLNNYTQGKNVEEFLKSLTRFESALGLNLLTNKSDITTRLEKIKRQEKLMERKNVNGRNYVSRALKNSGFSEIAEENQLLTWSISTQTGHGTVYEAVRDLIYGERRLGGKIATDSISIGKIHGNINTELIEKLIDQKLDLMAEELAQTAIQEREDRLIDYSQALTEANDSLMETERNLGKTLAELNNLKIEDIFIYHESLKLYSSIEVSEKGERRTTKFHGREMQVFSALDNLFSLSDLGVIDLPNKDALYGLVLNLADGAVAHSALPNVENYLSIFAGLLMFSDVRDMAQELARQTQQGVQQQNPTKIHLYLLNDTYVPGSMILTYVSQTLAEGYSHISVKDGAKVSINTNAAAKTIKDYLDAREAGREYSIDDWPEVADTIASNTLMQINFLSSYVSFIKKIAKTI